jgi:hypothetical protein
MNSRQSRSHPFAYVCKIKLASMTLKLTKTFLLLWVLAVPSLLLSQEMGALKVTLGVKDGKLVVASSEFKANGIAFPSLAKTELEAFLNRSFAEMDSLYEIRATQWDFPDMASQPLDEVFYEGYGYLTKQDGVGREVSEAFNEQVMLEGSDVSLSDFIQLNIFGPMASNLWVNSPLGLDLDGLLQSAYQKLEFEFTVKPPISLDSYVINWDGGHVLPKSKTRNILKGLDGQLYFRRKIKARVERYFKLTKYQLNYVISDLEVTVRPARLTRVIVKTKEKDAVHKVLYQVLPAAYFEIAIKIPVDSLPKYNNGDGYIFSLFGQVDGNLAKLPKIQTDVLQISLIQLGKLNYSLESLTESDWLEVPIEEKSSYSEIYISEVKANTTAMNCPERIPATNEDGVTATNDLPTDHASFDNERIDSTTEKCDKPKANSIGFGFDYSMGDGADIYLHAQHTAKDASSFSVQLGYAFNETGFKEGSFFFTGNYFKDYLFFDALQKRLSFQVTGQSSFTNNRVLEGVATKERRNGGKLRFQLDWFRDANGQQLSTNLGLQRQYIQLHDFQDVVKSEMTLSFLEIGKTWFFGKSSAHRTNYLLVEPALKLGIAEDGNGGDAENYLVSNLHCNWQRRWPGGFGFSLSGYWQHGSAHTPLVEKPALSTSANRGFRQDDVIADDLVGLQPEIWLPLPHFGEKTGGFNDYLFERVRLAIFADVSWYAGGQYKGNDFLLSPGLGLRFIEFPAQVNFDWAWGIAPTNLNAGKSRFSISLTLKAPI